MKVDLTRLERIDFLIGTKSTGNPKELAKRLGLSLRAWYNLKKEMENWGAIIAYSKVLGSYHYVEYGKFQVGFVKKEGG